MQATTAEKQEFCRVYFLTKIESSGKKLFPHQSEALDKLHKWFRAKQDKAGSILVLPTDGGKTITTWHFLCNGPLSQGYKVLWLAHTCHLLEQAFYGLARLYPSVESHYSSVFQNLGFAL